MDLDRIRAIYDRWAATYDSKVDMLCHRLIPERLIGELGAGPARILDLGCGTGKGADRLFADQQLVGGVDISPKMIEQASRRPYVALYCQELTQLLPDKEYPFDAVMMIGVMELVVDPAPIIAYICRALRARGLLGITFPLNRRIASPLEPRAYSTDEIEASLGSRLAPLWRETFLGYESEGERVLYEGMVLRKIS
jgi:predicted TPR repeat methyltransferase